MVRSCRTESRLLVWDEAEAYALVFKFTFENEANFLHFARLYRKAIGAQAKGNFARLGRPRLAIVFDNFIRDATPLSGIEFKDNTSNFCEPPSC